MGGGWEFFNGVGSRRGRAKTISFRTKQILVILVHFQCQI